VGLVDIDTNVGITYLDFNWSSEMTVVYEELTTEFAYRLTLQSLKVKSVMLYQFFCVQ